MSAIPEGWKLVPIEPTLDMCLAGASARIAIETPTPAEAAYKAMLAAAPQPPVSHAKPENQAEPLGRLLVFKDDEAAFGFSYDIAGNQQQHMKLQALDGAPLYTAPQPIKREPCIWTQVDDEHAPDTWQGSCGAVWSFIDGGPADNGQRFCPKCGSECKEVRGEA